MSSPGQLTLLAGLAKPEESPRRPALRSRGARADQDMDVPEQLFSRLSSWPASFLGRLLTAEAWIFGAELATLIRERETCTQRLLEHWASVGWIVILNESDNDRNSPGAYPNCNLKNS